MFKLIDFVNDDEQEIGTFETREAAIAMAEQMGLIDMAFQTYGEEGALIRHNGKDEII